MVDPTTNEITAYTQEEPEDTLKVTDPQYFEDCRTGMYLVVNGPEGTGRRAFFGAKYKAAGKSGTAQVVSIKQGEKYNAAKLKVEHRDNALFVAYAPFKQPRILVAVILENEGGGSTKAAPVARAMIDKYLLDLYPNGYMGDPNPQVVKFGMGGTVVLQ
jgi:penicillin-binding protein 2